MTTFPRHLDDEPIGIILRTGNGLLRPARIWAYCWCADDEENGTHPHERIPLDRALNV
jgi:hypothetical protein